jgi:UPF0755 protein
MSVKKILIPEGFSVREIIDRLDAQAVVSKNVFETYLRQCNKADWINAYPFLNPKLDGEKFFEGYLFPDTYIFAEDTTPQAVLEYMLQNFQRRALPILMKGNKTRYSIREIVTLASIVEKEAEIPEERSVIAGIYYNRLKKWMQLGSCPTVKYALGQPRKEYLLYRDLEVKSPYNTYKHYGLPPGPICSPGLLSIKAVLNPQKTDYLFFVSRGDGSHIFTLSFKEHLEKQREMHGNKIY